MSTFQGWHYQKSNFVQMPNDFLDMTAECTFAETRLIFYILRHTWGFQEFDTMKKITTDEFVNGRKMKDGTRMDGGVHISVESVRKGLIGLEEKGFIKVKVDKSDLGRIKKYYSLVMTRSKGPDPQNLGMDSKNLGGRSPESRERSEKETFRKKPLERKGQRYADTPPKLGISKDEEDWFTEQGAFLRSILVRYNADLVAPKNGHRPVSLKTLSETIQRLRIERDVGKKDIVKILSWLEDHYDDHFVPKIRKVDDLYNNWSRFTEAKKNQEFDEDRKREENDYILLSDGEETIRVRGLDDYREVE